MTTATRLSALFILAISVGACTSTVTPSGVLAINLRTGETRTFADEDSVPDGWAACGADMTCPAPLDCDSLDESACIVRTDCDPIYAEGPPDAPTPFVSCSGPACAIEDCGPALGAPAYVCDDGSIGGNTGRCIRGETGVCGWELRDCPTTDCTLEECGPAPGAPNFMCADGSWGGPGPCERNAEGICGYTWRDCPPLECSETDCGPAPGAAPRCGDGSTSLTVCVNVDGVCGWQFECPSCEPADCGPAPGADPMCSDGSSAALVCEPSATGACGWQFICPGE